MFRQTFVGSRALGIPGLALFMISSCGFVNETSFVPHNSTDVRPRSVEDSVQAAHNESASTLDAASGQGIFSLDLALPFKNRALTRATDITLATEARSPGLSQKAAEFSLPRAVQSLTVKGPGGVVFQSSKPGGRFNWAFGLPSDGLYLGTVNLTHPDSALATFEVTRTFELIRDIAAPEVFTEFLLKTDPETGFRKIESTLQLKDISPSSCEPLRIADFDKDDFDVVAPIDLKSIQNLKTGRADVFANSPGPLPFIEWNFKIPVIEIQDLKVANLAAHLNCSDGAGNSIKQKFRIAPDHIEYRLNTKLKLNPKSFALTTNKAGYAVSNENIPLEFFLTADDARKSVTDFLITRDSKFNFIYAAFKKLEFPVSPDELVSHKVAKVNVRKEFAYPVPAEITDGAQVLYIMHTRWNKATGIEEFVSLSEFPILIDRTVPLVEFSASQVTDVKTGIRTVSAFVKATDATDVTCEAVRVKRISDAAAMEVPGISFEKVSYTVLPSEKIYSFTSPVGLKADVPVDLGLDIYAEVLCKDIVGNSSSMARVILDDEISYQLSSTLSLPEAALVGGNFGERVRLAENGKIVINHTLKDSKTGLQVSPAVLERERNKLVIYVSPDPIQLPIDTKAPSSAAVSSQSYSERTEYSVPQSWTGKRSVYVTLATLVPDGSSSYSTKLLSVQRLEFYVDPFGASVSWEPKRFLHDIGQSKSIPFSVVIRAEGVPVVDFSLEYSTDNTKWIKVSSSDLDKGDFGMSTNAIATYNMVYKNYPFVEVTDFRLRARVTDQAGNVTISEPSPLLLMSKSYALSRTAVNRASCSSGGKSQSNFAPLLASEFICRNSAGVPHLVFSLLNHGLAPIQFSERAGSSMGVRTARDGLISYRRIDGQNMKSSAKPEEYSEWYLLPLLDADLETQVRNLKIEFDIEEGNAGGFPNYSTVSGSSCGVTNHSTGSRPTLVLVENGVKQRTLYTSAFSCESLGLFGLD